MVTTYEAVVLQFSGSGATPPQQSLVSRFATAYDRHAARFSEFINDKLTNASTQPERN